MIYIYVYVCKYVFVVVQLLSHVRLFVTPLTVAHQAPLSLSISWSLPKLLSIELVMPSYHLILWHSLLLLPSIFPSVRVFSNELALHIRWPKFWSFSISPSNEYSKFISFGIDCFDLLAVQGTFTTRYIHSRVSFLFWPAATFFLELLVIALHSSPVANWIPSNLVCSLLVSYLSILSMGFLRQEY